MASILIKERRVPRLMAPHFVTSTSRETLVKNCFSSVNSGAKIFQFQVKVSIYIDIVKSILLCCLIIFLPKSSDNFKIFFFLNNDLKDKIH